MLRIMGYDEYVRDFHYFSSSPLLKPLTESEIEEKVKEMESHPEVYCWYFDLLAKDSKDKANHWFYFESENEDEMRKCYSDGTLPFMRYKGCA